jgi:hypothetical protein
VGALLALAVLAGPPVGDPWIDGGLTLGAGVGWVALERSHDDLVDPSCPCAADDVAGWERFSVDADLADAEPLSNLALGIALVTPGLLLAATSPEDDWAGDALIVYQSAIFAGFLTQITKTAVARPFPYMLRDDVTPGQQADGGNYASMWSGHTAVPMAAAVSLGVVVSHRHPEAAWRWWVWTLGPALALTTGALQIAAANHYPSDVLVGAAVGAGVAAVDTWAHGYW